MNKVGSLIARVARAGAVAEGQEVQVRVYYFTTLIKIKETWRVYSVVSRRGFLAGHSLVMKALVPFVGPHHVIF